MCELFLWREVAQRLDALRAESIKSQEAWQVPWVFVCVCVCGARCLDVLFEAVFLVLERVLHVHVCVYAYIQGVCRNIHIGGYSR